MINLREKTGLISLWKRVHACKIFRLCVSCMYIVAFSERATNILVLELLHRETLSDINKVCARKIE